MKKSTAVMPSMGKLNKNKVAVSYQLSIAETLAEAFKRIHGVKMVYIKAIAWIIAVNIVLSIILSILSASLGRYIVDSWFIISWLVNAPLFVGIKYLGVRRSVDLPIEGDTIFKMYHFFWRIIGVRVLIALLSYSFAFSTGIAIGSANFFYQTGSSLWLVASMYVLSVIAVIFVFYFSYCFMFASLLVVEKKLTILSAMKTSMLAFNQHWFRIIIIFVIMGLLLLISVIPLLIPLIWTMPMYSNAIGIIYRTAFGVKDN